MRVLLFVLAAAFVAVQTELQGEMKPAKSMSLREAVSRRSSYVQHCGGNYVCDVNDRCCLLASGGYGCCSGTCCPNLRSCCSIGSYCCPTGGCCRQGSACCDGACCPPGSYCCGNGRGCCRKGTECCEAGGCCGAGSVCCYGNKCCRGKRSADTFLASIKREDYLPVE